jgi:hypothetical protein
MLIGKWRYKIMCNNVIYSPLRQQTWKQTMLIFHFDAFLEQPSNWQL